VILILENISAILAFSAGLLSFLSPCVLPLVPAYIGYLTGTSISELNKESKLNALYKSLGFVIGFSIIFIIMGASATTLGKILINYQWLLRKVGGVLIILFGLHTLGLIKIKRFYYEKKFLSTTNTPNNFSSIFMGMAFAAGWTPCIGPILSSILIYAASTATISKGIFLLIVYSLGLAIPFVLTALLIENFLKYRVKLLKYIPILSAVSGILMVLMGILIFTNTINILSRYLYFFNF
jgi:cytochrome c-type biogenesis protein